MWLRDHLPNHPDFRNSRIMTYGYDTQLFNGKGTRSRFEDYADQLLVLLGNERTTAQERARPIMFLCHSMGGLIARLAMVRYEKYPRLHPDVSLGPRGLLLLSTPNAGALDAQWSDLSLALGDVLGLRRSLIDELKVLNPHHIDAVNDWETLQYKPLVRCYCESSSTALAPGWTGTSRQVRNTMALVSYADMVFRLLQQLLLVFLRTQLRNYRRQITTLSASLKRGSVRHSIWLRQGCAKCERTF